MNLHTHHMLSDHFIHIRRLALHNLRYNSSIVINHRVHCKENEGGYISMKLLYYALRVSDSLRNYLKLFGSSVELVVFLAYAVFEGLDHCCYEMAVGVREVFVEEFD